ncbi:MAG TPA: hypothetical protein ENF60_02015 [Candidatus Omnitrophica bacterium]|nr:hypothetical protein [Candidatus Omnitrophota bacterium]
MNIAWRRKFAWSYERQWWWDFCPRGYYYNYIMEWEQGIDKQKLMTLKSLLSREELQRNLILEGIEELIKGNSLNHVKENLEQKLYQILRNPSDFLIPGEQAYFSFEEMRKVINNYLNNFLSLFHPSGTQGYFYRLQEKVLYKGLPILVAPDFVFQDPQKVIISKLVMTSSVNPEVFNLEACSLVLWAEEKFNIERENVSCNYYYLSEPRIERKRYSAWEIEKWAEKIITSAHRMLVVKSIEDFSPTPSLEKCRLCKFCSICADTRFPLREC